MASNVSAPCDLELAAPRPDPCPHRAAGRRDRQRHQRLDVRGGAQRDARAGGRGWPPACRAGVRHARRRRCRRPQRPAGPRGAGSRGIGTRDRGARGRGRSDLRRHLRPRGGATGARRRRGGDQRHRRRVGGDVRPRRRTRLRAGPHAHRGPAAVRAPDRGLRRRGRAPEGLVLASASKRRSAGASPPSRSRSTRASTSTSTVEDDLQVLARLGELRRARQAAVRLAVAKGLPRRRAGRLLGGSRARLRSASGRPRPPPRSLSREGPRSSACTTQAPCRRCGSPAGSLGRWC